MHVYRCAFDEQVQNSRRTQVSAQVPSAAAESTWKEQRSHVQINW